MRGGGPGTRETDCSARSPRRGGDAVLLTRRQRLRPRRRRRRRALARGARAAATGRPPAWCRSSRRRSSTTSRTGDPRRGPGPDAGYAACEARRGRGAGARERRRRDGRGGRRSPRSRARDPRAGSATRRSRSGAGETVGRARRGQRVRRRDRLRTASCSPARAQDDGEIGARRGCRSPRRSAPPDYGRRPRANTTLACVMTDAALDKAGVHAWSPGWRAPGRPRGGPGLHAGRRRRRVLPGVRAGRDATSSRLDAGRRRRGHGGRGRDPGRGAAVSRSWVTTNSSGAFGIVQWAMPGNYKTEAVVLRSIRYGEADRILHLYSATRGRIGAIAKGSRRPRSRFGGRLEPFFRLDLVLHEGRGELATVTGAHTVDGHPHLRSNGPALDGGGAGLRRGAAPARLRRGQPARLQPALPLPGAARRPGVGGGDGAGTGRPARRRRSPSGSSWRSRPASPRSSPRCARCGEADGLVAFSGAAGGVVCAACERRRLRALRQEAHRFMVEALGSPLADGADASERGAAPGRAGDHRDARAPRPRAAARRRLALAPLSGGGRAARRRGAGPRAARAGWRG